MKKEVKKERKTIDEKDLSNVSGGINIDSDAYGLRTADNNLNALSGLEMLDDPATLENTNAQGILEVTALTNGKRKIDSIIKDNLNQNNATVKSNNKLSNKK